MALPGITSEHTSWPYTEPSLLSDRRTLGLLANNTNRSESDLIASLDSVHLLMNPAGSSSALQDVINADLPIWLVEPAAIAAMAFHTPAERTNSDSTSLARAIRDAASGLLSASPT